MELELGLGLALPAATHHSASIKDFDLNKNGFESKESMMKTSVNGSFLEMKKQKRSFGQAFENGEELESGELSLFIWSGQPNEDGNPEKERKEILDSDNTHDEEDNEIVGWPPVESWRKKLLHWVTHDRIVERDNTGLIRNNTYVKVKMEGIGIGRKIDISRYDSYQVLISDLLDMFAKYRENEKEGADFTVLFQDREGDWLLARDVQWQTFVESVQRIEILRNIGN